MSTPYDQEPPDSHDQRPWAQPQGPVPPPGTGPYHGHQAPWPAQPSAWGPLPPTPYGQLPPKKSRTGLIIGLSVAAAILLIAVGFGALAVISNSEKNSSAGTSPSAGSHTIAIPASAAGYTQMTGNVARRLIAATRKQASKASPDLAAAYAKAKIGYYTRPGSPTRLVFVGFSAADSAQIASAMRSEGPSAGLDSFLLGAGVSNTNDFPAGPLGGVLRCGKTTRAGVPVTICAWEDSSVLAMVAEGATSQRRLARVSLAFRAAAEH